MFEGNDVRVVIGEHGEPWFVAQDVCDCLEHTDTSKAVSRLDDDEKLVRTLFGAGQNRHLLTVNESGLFNLILTSRKPEAKRMKKWVTSEVLPSIRKTGSYSVQQKPMTQIELILATAQVLADVEKRLVATEQQSKQVQGTVAKHETKFLSIESDLEDVKNTSILEYCPTHAEPITAIRTRINKLYGLSTRVVDEIIRQSPLAIKPIHTIRNTNPAAKGSSYFVYAVKDVNKLFSEFVSKAEMVSLGRYKHPYIEGTFKLNK